MAEQVTLQSLPEAMKEDKYNKIATWILKYRKYTTNAAMVNAPQCDVAPSTLKQYFDGGVYYLLSGQRNGGITTSVINALESLRNQISAYMPSSCNMRRTYKTRMQKKNVTPPVAQMKIVQQPLTAPIKYGVMRGNVVIVFDREDVARAYNDGLQFAKINDGKLVTLEIEELS